MWQIKDAEFQQFQRMMHNIAGVYLSAEKKNLVVSRLGKRLQHFGLQSFSEYLGLLEKPEHTEEMQVMVDLLTTNETYFFREIGHFQLLDSIARQHQSRQHQPKQQEQSTETFRVWSAACSSGQEAYSIAMTLADALRTPAWEVVASDISSQMLKTARKGLYPMAQAEKISPERLRRYCMKGVGPMSGHFMMDSALREKVRFCSANLNQSLPDLGAFDVIFLRNVLIYFDLATKQKVVQRLLYLLKPGGHFFVSHSESLTGINNSLTTVQPSVYRKP